MLRRFTRIVGEFFIRFLPDQTSTHYKNGISDVRPFRQVRAAYQKLSFLACLFSCFHLSNLFASFSTMRQKGAAKRILGIFAPGLTRRQRNLV
jgi:hypothetical protein